jgi:hypothetical protein
LFLLGLCATAGWQTQKLKAASSRTAGIKLFTKRIENPPQIKVFAQRQGETNDCAAFSLHWLRLISYHLKLNFTRDEEAQVVSLLHPGILNAKSKGDMITQYYYS